MPTKKANSETSGLKREKYTLLTNIREVGYKDVRLFCNAVLLSEVSSGMPAGPHWTIRGFGTEAAWHNFMIHLAPDHFPYTLTPFENQMVQILRENGRTEPIFTGNVLTFADGTEFKLYAAQNNKPIDVYVQHGDITKVWDILADKTREYWDAPYMPHLSYSSAKIRSRDFGM